ncbi:MAG: DUF4249 domain-containing protein [Taibaiella sp.]|nr:DUF4249 domain-containing protein [Taibaiella sp.]
MYRTLRAIALIAIPCLMTSCEKVLTIKPDAAPTQPVVEAIITNHAGEALVVVSNTRTFEQTNDFEGISGAVVSITDDEGNITMFGETSTGYFESPMLQGIPGHTYTLSVSVNGQEFTAVSTMPSEVEPDSLFARIDNTFGEERRLVNIVFQDPATEKNQYRFVQYRNGERIDDIFTRNDERTNGNKITLPLRYMAGDEEQLQVGDNVTVDMQCISAEMYKYLYGLSTNTPGGVQSATPANPETNMRGGALGYFSAHTSTKKSLTIN